MDGLRSLFGGIGAFGGLGRRLWRDQALAAALRLFRQSAGDMLDGWFDSDPIKAVLGFDAVVGNLASPYAPGSAYVLLHHAFGEVNGKRGVWGHAMGGMGAITKALARAAGGAGVRIDTGAAVREVLIERGRAAGVVLQDGTAVRARAIIANVDPHSLFQALLPADAVPRAAAARMRDWKAGSGTFRMNVALSQPAGFHRAAGCGRPSHRRHYSRAESRPIWTRPIATAAIAAGAESRSSNWSFRRRSTIASRQRAPMSRACSASMSPRLSPTGRTGRRTARRSPTS